MRGTRQGALLSDPVCVSVVCEGVTVLKSTTSAPAPEVLPPPSYRSDGQGLTSASPSVVVREEKGARKSGGDEKGAVSQAPSQASPSSSHKKKKKKTRRGGAGGSRRRGEWWIGRAHSLETRRKMSEAKKGRMKPWNAGGCHDPETRKRIKATVVAHFREKDKKVCELWGITLDELDRIKAAKRKPLAERRFVIQKYQDRCPPYLIDRLIKKTRMEGDGMSESEKKKSSDRMKAKWQSPEYRKHMEKVFLARPAPTAETRRKIATSVKNRWKDPQYREALSRKISASCLIRRESRSMTMKLLWKRPAFRRMMLGGSHVRRSLEHAAARSTYPRNRNLNRERVAVGGDGGRHPSVSSAADPDWVSEYAALFDVDGDEGENPDFGFCVSGRDVGGEGKNVTESGFNGIPLSHPLSFAFPTNSFEEGIYGEWEESADDGEDVEAGEEVDLDPDMIAELGDILFGESNPFHSSDALEEEPTQGRDESVEKRRPGKRRGRPPLASKGTKESVSSASEFEETGGAGEGAWRKQAKKGRRKRAQEEQEEKVVSDGEKEREVLQKRPRGRPRKKERKVVVVEKKQEDEKRPRGRPRKKERKVVVVEKKQEEEKRPRGRPRKKERKVVVVEKKQEEEKRPRGRPRKKERKVVVVEKKQEEEKRPRGRPRNKEKEVAGEVEEKGADLVEEGVTKRGRGRPRKASTECNAGAGGGQKSGRKRSGAKDRGAPSDGFRGRVGALTASSVTPRRRGRRRQVEEVSGEVRESEVGVQVLTTPAHLSAEEVPVPITDSLVGGERRDDMHHLPSTDLDVMPSLPSSFSPSTSSLSARSNLVKADSFLLRSSSISVGELFSDHSAEGEGGGLSQDQTAPLNSLPASSLIPLLSSSVLLDGKAGGESSVRVSPPNLQSLLSPLASGKALRSVGTTKGGAGFSSHVRSEKEEARVAQTAAHATAAAVSSN
uniref:Nuclease associated modular domain-containing protein n=1 Tax=Chromera velia CCMP2878 TaxID=1169474 RepID=A0A0G4HM60_9ALVE|eukprot:Cvel_1153.t1-p1 / transcript=Cvel_1153.t1 / gene=Cvel_1153 / organism=Chromera_velia_CCMP2878 / gene_product=hypothetical protein / transcript_product=hypothetical protein / location=Cvel_scaffold38:74998-77844(-) / protein_length=949 / sequence_SO=supercontig / SO=protein_coding / is_pseudo=false